MPKSRKSSYFHEILISNNDWETPLCTYRLMLCSSSCWTLFKCSAFLNFHSLPILRFNLMLIWNCVLHDQLSFALWIVRLGITTKIDVSCILMLEESRMAIPGGCVQCLMKGLFQDRIDNKQHFVAIQIGFYLFWICFGSCKNSSSSRMIFEPVYSRISVVNSHIFEELKMTRTFKEVFESLS